MKKLNYFAMMGAIALTGLVTFTACSSSEDAIEPNPDYNEDANTVKTEFAISVTPPSARTRMAGGDTQASGNFRGMAGMSLICFNGVPADATAVSDGFFNLSDISNATGLTDFNQVYSMYLPIGTTNFLFYGKAAGTTASDAMTKGSIAYNVDKTSHNTPTTITFSLNTITTRSALEVDNGPEYQWLAYLNGIAEAKYTDTEPTDHPWSASTETKVAKLYNNFISFTPGSRQGSAKAILETAKKLYFQAATIYNATGGDAVPDLEKNILKAVMDKIAVLSTGTGLIKLTDDAKQYATDADLTFKSTDTDVTTFPIAQNVPSGATSLQYDNTAHKFKYMNDGGNEFGTLISADVSKICYPSELTYYSNSPLYSSTLSKKLSTDFPATTVWDTEASWSGWGTSIDATTRSVAMKNRVRYGVALLETTFKLEDGSYYDNAYACTDGETANQLIAVGTSSFKVTGIIVGSQPAAVDYQFIPNSTTYDKMVYDHFSTEGVAVGTSASASNFTLLLDNLVSGDNPTQKNQISVALELINMGGPFYGKSGLIATGQTFYLIGALNLPEFNDTDGDQTNNSTWTDTEAGAGYPVSKAKRVFAQDFRTVANFTIKSGKDATDANADSFLKNAYSVIPDLRVTQMTFGLSVDLQWKSGLTFNTDI